MTRLSLVLALLLSSAVARAECRASPSGQSSISVTFSPLSGVLCVNNVAIHRGEACGGEPVWGTQFACGETRRMVVTDDGALVSLLASRASRRDWEIVRIFHPRGDRLEVRSIRLADLPGLPERARRPRMSIDTHHLRVAVEPALSIPIADLRNLGRVRARRRLSRRTE